MAAVAWYYCAGNSVYYWTKAYDMSATQFAIAVSERIGRTITASEYYTFFVDIYATKSLRDFIFSLSKVILESLKPFGKKK